MMGYLSQPTCLLGCNYAHERLFLSYVRHRLVHPFSQSIISGFDSVMVVFKDNLTLIFLIRVEGGKFLCEETYLLAIKFLSLSTHHF